MKDGPDKNGEGKHDQGMHSSPAPPRTPSSDHERVYIARLMIMGFSEEEIKQILDLDKLFD